MNNNNVDKWVQTLQDLTIAYQRNRTNLEREYQWRVSDLMKQKNYTITHLDCQMTKQLNFICNKIICCSKISLQAELQNYNVTRLLNSIQLSQSIDSSSSIKNIHQINLTNRQPSSNYITKTSNSISESHSKLSQTVAKRIKQETYCHPSATKVASRERSKISIWPKADYHKKYLQNIHQASAKAASSLAKPNVIGKLPVLVDNSNVSRSLTTNTDAEKYTMNLQDCRSPQTDDISSDYLTDDLVTTSDSSIGLSKSHSPKLNSLGNQLHDKTCHQEQIKLSKLTMQRNQSITGDKPTQKMNEQMKLPSKPAVSRHFQHQPIFNCECGCVFSTKQKLAMHRSITHCRVRIKSEK